MEAREVEKKKWGLVSFQRRRYPRIDITLPVEYRLITDREKPPKSVVAMNISAGGLLLILSEYLPVSSCLEMTLYIGDRSINTVVQIAWTELLTGREINEFRCGVFFVNISEGDLEFIKQFIKEYMERRKS